MNKSMIASFLIFSIVFSGTAFAFSLPCAFVGTVKLNDTLVNGTLVTAYLNDTGEYLATAKEASGFGNYTITITNASDKFVRFKVAGAWANEPEQYCAPGNVSYFDITANLSADGEPCDQGISCSSGICLPSGQTCNGPKYCRPTDPYPGDGCCQTTENCLSSPSDCACQSGQYCNAGVCQQYCGNHMCDNGETCATCPIDCGGCGGGGGGGGGGGSYITPCKENWTCSDWNSCADGTQTRNCTDLNKCNTIKSKPNTTQTCVVTCTENWSCTDWSVCTNNQQTRTCTDANSCPTAVSKPVESQDCIAETTQTIPETSTITGQFLGLTTMDWLTAVIVGIVVAIIILFIIKRKKSKKR